MDRFDWVGRTLEADEGMALAPTTISADRAEGIGIIACFRMTTGDTRAIGFARSGSGQNVKYGQGPNGRWNIRNSAASDAEHTTAAINTNTTYVAFAYSYSSTNHWLAVNSIRTLEQNTTSVTLFQSTSLCVGYTDGTGNQGDFRGDFYWVGALKAFPPRGLLHDVLTQSRPPTILRPWLAHLIPFLGRGTDERCIITGGSMVPTLGTMPAATRRGGRPQMPPLNMYGGLGRATRRYTLTVSHGGDSETAVSATTDASAAADVVLLEIPQGTEREIGIGVNGPVSTVATLAANPNAQSGNLIIGARLNAGAAVSEATTADIMGTLVSGASDLGAQALILESADEYIAPILTITDYDLPIAADSTLDLTTVVNDPAGYGWDAFYDEDADPAVTTTLSGTDLTMRAEETGDYTVPVRLRSRHPRQPERKRNIRVRAGANANAFSNGFKYRRKITRTIKSSVPAGNLPRFPVPIRIDSQTWAKSTANGGKLEVAPFVDFQVEDSAGNIIPLEIRPDNDLSGGSHVIVYSQDSNPAVSQDVYLYYGKRMTAPTERPETVWQDYWAVYAGGPNPRNGASLSRDWDVTEVATVAGQLGKAGDFASTQAEVSYRDAAFMDAQSAFDFCISYKRTDATDNNYGPIGIGADLSTEFTAQFTLRDATSATESTNALKFSLKTTTGRAQWRSATNATTTNWQVAAFTWRSGQPVVGYLDGAEATPGNPVPNTVGGTTTISGPIVIGLAGGVSLHGKWPGLIDEIRIGKLGRSAAWRAMEYLSLTDPTFVTIGDEEIPSAVTAQIITRPDDFTVDGTAGTFALLDVLANDERNPAAALTLQNPTLDGEGSVSIESNQIRLDYTPGFDGVVSGTYEATDGVLTKTEIWQATVQQAGITARPDVMTNVGYTAGGSVLIDVLANDSRNPPGALSISAATTESGGTIAITGTSAPAPVSVFERASRTIVLPAGSTQGVLLERPNLPPQDEYFLDYEVTFASDFEWDSDTRIQGKFPGLSRRWDRTKYPTDDPTSNSVTAPVPYDAFSFRLMWHYKGEVATYLYHQDNTGFGEKRFFLNPDGTRLRLNKGQTYRFTYQARVNTPGQANGIGRVYIDGQVAWQSTTMKWRGVRPAGQQPADPKWDAIMYHFFAGGSQPFHAPNRDSSVVLGPLHVLDRLPDFTKRVGDYTATIADAKLRWTYPASFNTSGFGTGTYTATDGTISETSTWSVYKGTPTPSTRRIWTVAELTGNRFTGIIRHKKDKSGQGRDAIGEYGHYSDNLIGGQPMTEAWCDFNITFAPPEAPDFDIDTPRTNCNQGGNLRSGTLQSGKIPGFGTDGVGSGGTRPRDPAEWSARSHFEPCNGTVGGNNAVPAAKRGLIRLSTYIYDQDRNARSDGTWGGGRKDYFKRPWGSTTLVEISKGVKYRWTQRVKINTPNVANGELEIWLDGVLVYRNLSMRWRGAVANTAAQIYSFKFHNYFGGGDCDGPTFDSFVKFGRVYILDRAPDFSIPLAD